MAKELPKLLNIIKGDVNTTPVKNPPSENKNEEAVVFASQENSQNIACDPYNVVFEENKELDLLNEIKVEIDIDYEQYVIDELEEDLEETKEKFQIQDIEENNVSDEEILSEAELKASAISMLEEILSSAQAGLAAQDNSDGWISEWFDAFKQTNGIDLTQSTVESAIKKQEEIINELKETLESGGDFEVKWEELTGVKYDEEKIAKYQQATTQIQFVQMGLNKVNSFCDSLAKDAQYDTQATFNKFIEFYGEEKGQEEFLKAITKGINSNFSSGLGTISKAEFSDDGNIILYDENNNPFEIGIVSDISPDNLTYLYSDKFKDEQINSYLENIENTTGINYQESLVQLGELSNEALGEANAVNNILNEYIQSQEGFVDTVAGVAQIGGLALMGIGAIAMAFNPPVGSVMMKTGQGMAIAGTFGDEAAEALDIATNNQNFKEDKAHYQEILDETITDIALYASGYAIGGVADDFGQFLMSKSGSRFASMVGEIGVDASLSLMSDLVITGEVDFTGEGMSQILGLITAIAGGKYAKIQGDVDFSTKPNVNDTQRLSFNPETGELEAPKVKSDVEDIQLDHEVAGDSVGSRLKEADKAEVPIRNIQNCIEELLDIDSSGELDQETVGQLFDSLTLGDGIIPEVAYEKVEKIMQHYDMAIKDLQFDDCCAENLNSILNFIKNTHKLIGIENFDNPRMSGLLDEIMEDGEYFSEEQHEALKQISEKLEQALFETDSDARLQTSLNIISKIFNDTNGEKTQEIIEQINRLQTEFTGKDLKTAVIEIYKNNLPEMQIKTKLLNNVVSEQVYDLIKPESYPKEVFNAYFSDVIGELTNRGYKPEDIKTMLQFNHSAFIDRPFSSDKPNIQLFADALEVINKIGDTSYLSAYTAHSGPFNDILTTPIDNPNDIPYVDIPQGEMYTFNESIGNIIALDSALENAKISHPMKVYRGEGCEVLNSYRLQNGKGLGDSIREAISSGDNAKIDAIIAEILGGEIIQPHFMSTAYVEDATRLFVKREGAASIIWDIDVPEGAKGLYMDPFNSVNEVEREVLFARNTKLIINDAYVDKDGIFRISAKMLK